MRSTFFQSSSIRAASCIALIVNVLATSSDAAVYVNGTTRQQMHEAGDYLQGFTVSLRMSISGFVLSNQGSGILYDPTHVLIAQHQLDGGALVPFAVDATGPGINWKTNPGPSVGVTRIDTFPGFNHTSDFPADAIDLAMLTLASPLPMTVATSGPIAPAPLLSSGAKVISDVSPGERIWSAGFGIWGTPATEIQGSDGDPGGWQGPVNPAPPAGAWPHVQAYYFETDFAVNGSLGPLNGQGANVDSGSPAVDEEGHLVGVTIYRRGNTFEDGGTGYLRLGHPDIKAWIGTKVMPGDFDANSTLDADDLDLVLRMTPGNVPTFKTAFDLNKDGQFASNPTATASDTSFWLTQLKHTTFGDADLSGAVSFEDLLVLAQHYGNADNAQGWAAGNFDGTAGVNFADLLMLAQHYGEGASPASTLPANVAADWMLARSLVPEPGVAAVLLVLGFSCRHARRQR